MKLYKWIYNLNRYLIIILLSLGFIADGIDLSDLFFLVASVLWLWLPECSRLEKRYLPPKQRDQ